MPGGDRTGPNGLGPMTGRGMGYCGGSGRPESAGLQMGGGRGFGRGPGRGMRNRFRNWRNGLFGDAPNDVTEKNLLEIEAKRLREQMESIEKRLAELQQGEEK
ncbi:MAG: DUF5320 domain-containing protein [Bacteroidales bacterium]|nr:DUF5320 domain-containing protein [Bacteroidales bacterium]